MCADVSEVVGAPNNTLAQLMLKTYIHLHGTRGLVVGSKHVDAGYSAASGQGISNESGIARRAYREGRGLVSRLQLRQLGMDKAHGLATNGHKVYRYGCPTGHNKTGVGSASCAGRLFSQEQALR